ncbi:MAG: hypothetical protein LBF88_00100 [Planctomycetaceae bacterium]|jgi:hypothetical protein|nr:hypothetical protein [Planctomycetaceae bacterium]
MKTLELPYIRFGRKKDGVTDFYDIREQTPSIPEYIVAFFRDRIAKSIQWESSEKTTDYADCFLIWRVNHSGFLFAKLSDGGNDVLKRNHSIQIDAVYLTNEQLPNTANNKALFFASLCFSSVWEHWEKHRILQPVDENEQKVAEISEKLLEFFSETALPIHSLFLASHQYFTPCGIDQIVYNIHNDKDLLNRESISVETKPINFSVSPMEEQVSSTFSPIKYVLLIIIVVLLSCIAGMSWSAWYWENKARILQMNYNLLQIECEEQKLELKELDNETLEILTSVEKQLQQIEEKNSEIEKLEGDIKKLKIELQDSRQNADESLKKENELLNTENEKLNKKLNQIYKYIEEIHKIICNDLSPENDNK